MNSFLRVISSDNFPEWGIQICKAGNAKTAKNFNWLQLIIISAELECRMESVCGNYRTPAYPEPPSERDK